MNREDIIDGCIMFTIYVVAYTYGVIVVMPIYALTIFKDKVKRFIHPPLYGLYRHGSKKVGDSGSCGYPSCECEEKLLFLSYERNGLFDKGWRGKREFGHYFIEEVKYWKPTSTSSRCPTR